MKFCNTVLLFSLFLILFSCFGEYKRKVNKYDRVVEASWDGRYIRIEKEKIEYESNEKGQVQPFNENEASNDELKHYYSINKIQIRGDSIFMDQLTAIIENGDTLISPTLGAIYYSGKLTASDSVRIGKLRLIGSDYVAFPTLKNAKTGKYEELERKSLNFKFQITDDGLLVDGVLYKKDKRAPFPLISDKRNLNHYLDSVNTKYLDSVNKARSKY